jgi:outer membrane protein insertion porin family
LGNRLNRKSPWLRKTLSGAIGAAFSLVSSFALAIEPFVVKDIRVDGLQRTEVGTIFSYLPVKIGETFNDEKAASAIRALFATGFFKDVKIEAQNGVLIIIVDERPAVGAIELSGVKEFDKEQLKKALADNGLAEGRIFDRSVLDRAEQELKRQYLSRGLLNAQVTTTVAPLERNRVAITISVVEGDSTKIAEMRIVGNKAFSEKQLLDQFNLTTPTWISWYTKTDQYAKEKLTADLETLKSFYLDRGYFEFGIESSQVSISPDKSGVFLSVVITEGEPFNVGELKFAGDMLGREEALRAFLGMKAGESFSGKKLSDSIRRMQDYLGELGYAFANVTPVPQVDREKRVVGFTFGVDPGRRAYVRRISIAGNQRTRDEVIRRELRQFEASWYDSDRIRLSRERVERLGFFKDVQLETKPVPDAPDQVDLLISVVEKPANSLTFGLGFSSAEKVSVNFGVNQENFLGTGRNVNLRLNTSKANRALAIGYVEPYLTDNGISRGFDVSTSRLNARELGLGSYSQRTSAIGLKFGIPYTEIDRVVFGLGYEDIRLDTDALSPLRLQNFVSQFGPKATALVASVAWSRDSRDNPLVPIKGRLQSASFELGLPGFEQRFYRVNYIDQLYYPINKDFTLGFYGDIAIGRGVSGKPYPVFKNYYAGGIGSVRAYETNSLGPRDPNGVDAQGASNRLQGSVELIFPLPGTGNDKTLRGFLFLDGGNVFASKFELGQLRYAAGIGLGWQSPLGPMKLSYGFPIKREPTDKLQRFQFQIGTGF